MKQLIQYLAKWDPMDFIKDLGAPEDEYSLEAATIAHRYKPEMNKEEVGILTYDTFKELIELDYAGFKEEAIGRGQDIKNILDSNT